VAREVVAPGSEGLAAVRRRFGDEIVRSDGSLDRAALRQRVFASDAERRDLEAILHPRIVARMQSAAQSVQEPYCILVIPLLVEKGLEHLVDRVLVVDAPVEVQRRRAAARDGTSTQEIARIIAAQASREERLARADDVIHNPDDDPSALRAQVLDAHHRYLALAGAA